MFPHGRSMLCLSVADVLSLLNTYPKWIFSVGLHPGQSQPALGMSCSLAWACSYLDVTASQPKSKAKPWLGVLISLAFPSVPDWIFYNCHSSRETLGLSMFQCALLCVTTCRECSLYSKNCHDSLKQGRWIKSLILMATVFDYCCFKVIIILIHLSSLLPSSLKHWIWGTFLAFCKNFYFQKSPY